MSNTELQKTEKSGLAYFKKYATHKDVSAFLSDVIKDKKDSFIANVTTLVANNAPLQSCNPASILYAALKATTLGLSLDNNIGQAYVVPYGNDAQFQIGYRGLIELAIRSGQYETINVAEVKDGDIISENAITGEIKCRDYTFSEMQERKSKETIGYAAYFKLHNGYNKTIWWSIDEINAHAKTFSKTFNSYSSPWKKNFASMAKKTVLKCLLSKWGSLSVDINDALIYDQAVIKEGNKRIYPDNPTATVDYEQIDAMLNNISDADSANRAADELRNCGLVGDDLQNATQKFNDKIAELKLVRNADTMLFENPTHTVIVKEVELSDKEKQEIEEDFLKEFSEKKNGGNSLL